MNLNIQGDFQIYISVPLTEKVKIIIIGTRAAGVTTNRRIAMAIGNGVVRLNSRILLKENGGSLELRERWVLHLSNCFQVKRKSCRVWVGTPSCYLEMLDKLQKRICRTVGPSLATSLELWAHRQNVASSSLFYCYYFGRCTSELAELVPLPYSWGRLLVNLIHCMILLSPFLDVTRMSISTVSFLTQLDPGILCLQNAFL